MTQSSQTTRASAVGHHDQLGTLASASAVVLAVGKPLSASIAASGRGRALCFIAVTYSLGLALSATARNMPTLFAGQMLYVSWTVYVVDKLTDFSGGGIVGFPDCSPGCHSRLVFAEATRGVERHAGGAVPCQPRGRR